MAVAAVAHCWRSTACRDAAWGWSDRAAWLRPRRAASFARSAARCAATRSATTPASAAARAAPGECPCPTGACAEAPPSSMPSAPCAGSGSRLRRDQAATAAALSLWTRRRARKPRATAWSLMEKKRSLRSARLCSRLAFSAAVAAAKSAAAAADALASPLLRARLPRVDDGFRAWRAPPLSKLATLTCPLPHGRFRREPGWRLTVGATAASPRAHLGRGRPSALRELPRRVAPPTLPCRCVDDESGIGGASEVVPAFSRAMR